MKTSASSRSAPTTARPAITPELRLLRVDAVVEDEEDEESITLGATHSPKKQSDNESPLEPNN